VARSEIYNRRKSVYRVNTCWPCAVDLHCCDVYIPLFMTWMSTYYRVTFYAARHRQRSSGHSSMAGRLESLTWSLVHSARTCVNNLHQKQVCWLHNTLLTPRTHSKAQYNTARLSLRARRLLHCTARRDVYINPPSPSAAPGAEKAFSCSLPRSAG
jgi:hypothetical protein